MEAGTVVSCEKARTYLGIVKTAHTGKLFFVGVPVDPEFPLQSLLVDEGIVQEMADGELLEVTRRWCEANCEAPKQDNGLCNQCQVLIKV